jgi:hypothetical protein
MRSSFSARTPIFKLPISTRLLARKARNHAFTPLLSTVTPSSILRQASASLSSALNSLATPFWAMASQTTRIMPSCSIAESTCSSLTRIRTTTWKSV